MPSNRPIPLPGGGAFLQVHTLEDGVLAVLFLDVQHGLLELALPGVGGPVCPLLLFLGGIIGKQVQLLRLLLGGVSLGDQFVGTEV